MKTTNFDPNRLQTPVTVLYDSSNAESVHEVEFLKSKNSESRLEFVDLAQSADSASDFGVGVEAVNQQLYARDASGVVVAGTDALYAAHVAIGLGNWFEMCRLPGFLSVGTGIGPKH